MLLVVCREDCKKQKAVKSHLSRCWSTRKDWWPSYHFTFKTTSSAAQSDLLASKILIASVLLGEGILHNFTENNTALKRLVIKFLEYWYRFFLTSSGQDWNTSVIAKFLFGSNMYNQKAYVSSGWAKLKQPYYVSCERTGKRVGFFKLYASFLAEPILFINMF